MRAGFLLALLFLASAYTYFAFVDLSWLSSSGRLGPGFFPRIIGCSLVALCLASLYGELRGRLGREAPSPFSRTAVVVGLLSAVFIALLDVLGGLVAMIVFMAAALAYLNRGRNGQNALLAVLMPLALYLLFHAWLSAAMPKGMLPFF